jgi:hypothetical protein
MFVSHWAIWTYSSTQYSMVFRHAQAVCMEEPHEVENKLPVWWAKGGCQVFMSVTYLRIFDSDHVIEEIQAYDSCRTYSTSHIDFCSMTFMFMNNAWGFSTPKHTILFIQVITNMDSCLSTLFRGVKAWRICSGEIWSSWDQCEDYSVLGCDAV